jgi:hypothetical protein
LHNLQFPGFHRKPFEQKVIDLSKSLGAYGFDDEIHINTQSGSQWDSLKHVRRHSAPWPKEDVLVRHKKDVDKSPACISAGESFL